MQEIHKQTWKWINILDSINHDTYRRLENKESNKVCMKLCLRFGEDVVHIKVIFKQLFIGLCCTELAKQRSHCHAVLCLGVKHFPLGKQILTICPVPIVTRGLINVYEALKLCRSQHIIRNNIVSNQFQYLLFIMHPDSRFRPGSLRQETNMLIINRNRRKAIFKSIIW